MKSIFVVIAMAFALIATPALVAIDLPLSLCGVNMEAKTVLQFYQGGRNDKGVTLEDIWAFDDATLEAKHDFIQWLFPLKKKGFNPTSALTNDDTIAAFKADSTLQDKMRKSFEVMLGFYGFEKKSDGSIEKASTFTQKSKNWLNPDNHNFLRITRILHSMKLRGKSFYESSREALLSSLFSDWL